MAGVRQPVRSGLLCLVVVALCAGRDLCAAEPSPAPLLTSIDELRTFRENPARWKRLINRCAREAGWLPTAVAVFSPHPRYSIFGRRPDALPTLAADTLIAYRAALCYAVSGGLHHARHAQAILDAWARTLRTVEGEQGRAEINFDFPLFVIAADWVRGAGGWDDTPFRRLLTDVVAPLSNAARANNHGNWGVLLEASIGAYLGDRAVLARARARWEALLLDQVAADGSLPRETCRSNTSDWCGGRDKGVNGLSYTHYALLPTTLSAKIFEQQGMSVWNTSAGARLAQAFARAASWTLHPETFPWFAANGGKLADVRNAAYFALLLRHYDNADAARVLADGDIHMDEYELVPMFGPGPVAR